MKEDIRVSHRMHPKAAYLFDKGIPKKKKLVFGWPFDCPKPTFQAPAIQLSVLLGGNTCWLVLEGNLLHAVAIPGIPQKDTPSCT